MGQVSHLDHRQNKCSQLSKEWGEKENIYTLLVHTLGTVVRWEAPSLRGNTQHTLCKTHAPHVLAKKLMFLCKNNTLYLQYKHFCICVSDTLSNYSSTGHCHIQGIQCKQSQRKVNYSVLSNLEIKQINMEGGQSGTYLRLMRASSGPWVSVAKTYRDEKKWKWIFRPDHSGLPQQ